MKKLLFCFLASASLVACSNQETKTAEQKTAKIEHIYKPTYTDNFKIGGESNVLITEKFHQAMFAKDFKQVGDYLADTAVFWMEDGSTIKGKDSMMKFVEANFSNINIKNYKQAVILPVVGENGHEWVLVWDEAEVESNGKTTRIQWQDGFRYSNGKVVAMNGFFKIPK